MIYTESDIFNHKNPCDQRQNPSAKTINPIPMKPRTLNFVTGFTFLQGWSSLGIIFILLGGLRLYFTKDIVFGAFILAGIAMLMNFDGVKFDLEKHTVKPYTLILGVLKLGKKYPQSKFPQLSVLRMTYRKGGTFIGFLPFSIGGSYEAYEVYMLSKSHLTKKLIQDCSTYEKALGIAEEIARHTGMEVVKFNPRGASTRRR